MKIEGDQKRIRLWKWQKGRQHGTDYWKFPLWYFRIFNCGFDAYILKYAPNTKLPWHTDPVENGEHWRKNITLKGFSHFFWKEGTNIESSWGKTPLFRPDFQEHCLFTYSKGCTKLSLGFVKYKN